ncbi:MAG TPA: hypothetical protein VK425_00035, partial [Acidimicrobiales bacterium]|nr:hypothetical protein [Acidimicrobiales bacterium]
MPPPELPAPVPVPVLDSSASPPITRRRPMAHSAHGDTRPDDWHWLYSRDDPEVIEYLKAENEYADAVLAPTRPLQELLFEQIKARVAETDISAPIFHHGWWYWSRTVAGQQYPIHCRRADPSRALSAAQVLAAARAALPGAGLAGDGTPPPQSAASASGVPGGTGGADVTNAAYGTGAPAGEAEPQPGRVILDENALAGDSEYFDLGVFDIRPDQEVLAYATDLDGSERYTLRFRDLGSGDELVDVVEDVTYGSAWSTSGKTFYYVRPDKAMRPWQVWRHTLGTPAARDQLVFQEDDERFYVSVGLTRSKCFVLITTESKMSCEVHYLRADKDRGHLSVVLPRREGVEYDVEHVRQREDGGDGWLVRTNRGPGDEELENFAVFELPLGESDPRSMRPFVPYRPEVKVQAVDAFVNYALMLERTDGLKQLRVVRLSDRAEHIVPQPEPAYTLSVEGTPEWGTDVVRFGYSSLVSPPSSVDYDMARQERTVVKEVTVGGGFQSSAYRTERLWAESPDGARVPISLVCRRGYVPDGS